MEVGGVGVVSMHTYTLEKLREYTWEIFFIYIPDEGSALVSVLKACKN